MIKEEKTVCLTETQERTRVRNEKIINDFNSMTGAITAIVQILSDSHGLSPAMIRLVLKGAGLIGRKS